MSHFLESKKIRTALWVLGSLIVLLVIFGLGISVGYDRANFGSHFEQNYYHDFYGGPATGSAQYAMGPAPMAEHGIAGAVIDVTSSTISVEDSNNNEHSITVSSGTVIREDNATIGTGDIKIDDQVVVIGEPNAQGQVDARFIRVFTSSSSIPTSQNQ
jgi:hypothetical protein